MLPPRTGACAKAAWPATSCLPPISPRARCLSTCSRRRCTSREASRDPARRSFAAGAPRLTPQVSYLYGGPGLDSLDYLGAALIGLVVFFLVFVITSVAFLRERSQGTLERLMASPLRRAEIVVGYMIGFTVLALLQSAEVLLFSLYVLKLHNAGSVPLI